MISHLVDILDRHEFAHEDRDELRRRLNERSAEELRGMLLSLSARLPQAYRLVQASTADEENTPHVDAEQIRAELRRAFEPVRGAFGKPASRGDHALEADVTEIARRGRDYEATGHLDSARTIYRVVGEELDANRHMLNPHRAWHHDLREALDRRIAELSDGD